MNSLELILSRALKEHWALPHFNVSNLEQLRGVCQAARKLRAPLLIGTSEGERDFIGLTQAVALARAYREDGLSVWVNADHTKSVAAAKEAIDAGYDSIHIDLSAKPLSENIAGTGEVYEYAKHRYDEISVEGEVGYLVTESSRLYKKKIVVDPQTFTRVADALKFVSETNVDRLAPAVGNLHGIALNRPKIDFKLVAKLRAALPENVAMVLHGGSGNSPRVFQKLIDLGFNNIHISTELRLAYRRALDASLRSSRGELAPYKIMEPVVTEVRKLAEKYIKIFRADNRL